MNLGYFDSIEKMPRKSKNENYVGYKGDKKFFIKKYVVRKDRKKEDMRRIRAEILCYQRLKGINTLNVFEADIRARLLVLGFRGLKSIGMTKKDVDRIFQLYEERIENRKTPFLPKVSFDYYTDSLFKRIKELRGLELVENADDLIHIFTKNRRLIEKAPKYFSHGDLGINNFKWDGDRLIMLDFEYSGQDNRMYDLASIYLSLYHNKRLRDYLYKKIRRKKFFDRDLFDVMACRRSIEMAYALRKTPRVNQVKSAIKIMNNGLRE